MRKHIKKIASIGKLFVMFFMFLSLAEFLIFGSHLMNLIDDKKALVGVITRALMVNAVIAAWLSVRD
jgi:CBS-domain-containing membrane protein